MSCEAVASVTPASTMHSFDPLRISRGRKSRPINVSRSNCRRLRFGKRSVPPATNIARGPRSAAMRAASRAVLGRRYLNRGSRSTVQVLGRRFDLDGRRIGDGWESSRAKARRFAFCFAPQRLDNLLGRDRDLVDPNSERVMNRRANCRGNWQERTLSPFFGAVRALRVDRLDDEGLDLRHVEGGGELGLEHRPPLVEDLPKRLL